VLVKVNKKCYKKFVSVSLAIGFFIIRHCEAWYKPWQSPAVYFYEQQTPLITPPAQLADNQANTPPLRSRGGVLLTHIIVFLLTRLSIFAHTAMQIYTIFI
jgi:hypothetical protein